MHRIPVRLAALFAASALLSPLPSLADAGACRYTPVATVPLRGSGPVVQTLVDGTINGQPMVMLFDTGAYTSELTLPTAERLKLSIDQTARVVSGAAGSAHEYSTKVRDISLGDAHSGPARMRVLGASGIDKYFDAILGADFALQMDLELAFAEHRLRFFRAHDCADTFLAYWDKDAMEVPLVFDGIHHDTPSLTVEINGQKIEAILDTGASRTTLTRAAAERIGLRTDSPEMLPGSGVTGVGKEKVASWHTVVDTFTIGSETIRNAHISVRDQPVGGSGHSPDLLLGADFLRAHRVLIARSQQRLYVSYLGGTVFPPYVPKQAKVDAKNLSKVPPASAETPPRPGS